MEKFRVEKGITLIALIISIIILLILAVVTIGNMTNRDIITYAQNASRDYTTKKDEEKTEINKYEDFLESEKLGMGKEKISATESYVGYYADIDADGTVDGIIYADLAVGGSGQYGESDEDTVTGGKYEITKKENLNNYYISQKSYKVNGFEEKAVISPIEKVEENDRFYVMTLTNFKVGENETFSWYYNAEENWENLVKDITSEEFGTGKENTKSIMEVWKKEEFGKQYEKDIWNFIDSQISKGWFVPSKCEMAAFGDLAEKNGLDSTNYQEYGFDTISCWTSSQSTYLRCPWFIDFSDMCMYTIDLMIVDTNIRLSTTF